jgi:RNAse P Rpr2/Rpp21/SNM1 subunit domain
MASHESALRLKFLQDSASVLRSQSTATAAHLMALHNHVLHENSKAIKARQHESWCGACGSPRKMSHTKVVRVKQRTGKEKSRPALKSGASNGVFVFKCLRCSSRTIQDRRPQTRAQQQKPSASAVSHAISTPSAPTGDLSLLGSADMSSTSEASTRATLENASSKKRAKARKQGGLQALLASKQRSQESKPSGSSLDLFDFLQQ